MEKELWFSEVDRAVTHDRTLSATDKSVYNALCYYADRNTRECQPKVAAIAFEASCSPRSVHRSLNVLEARGAIQRTPRFRGHKQIASLYLIIGYKAICYSETGYTATDVEKHIADTSTDKVSEESYTDYHTNITADNNSSECMPDCQTNHALPNCHSVVSVPTCQTNHSVTDWQTEKTLESLKIPYGGACLPASAEKEESEGTDARIPEEVIPEEKTKDSLTGGALLPISECKDQNPENPQGDIASASEAKNEETLFIRAEYDETAQTDTAQTAVCENPVIRPDVSLTATVSTTATGEVVIPEIPEWLMKQYEAAKKRYAELYDQPKPAEAPKKAEQPPLMPETPEPGTTEFYQWKLENTRKVSAELCAELYPPVKEPMSISSGLADVMADIRKRTVSSETSVVKAEEKCEASAPSDNPTKVPEPAEEVKPSTADSIPPVSDTPTSLMKTPQTVAKPTAPKNTVKGKGTVSRHPKELYSPADAPEIMRATAEYFLFKTGRVALRWEEIAVLRKFSATQYPAMVQKEIVRACERFKKRKESLKCLTLMYVAVALEKRPTYGKKKELSEEKKKYFAQYEPERREKTEEEKAAARAKLKALEATLNPDD